MAQARPSMQQLIERRKRAGFVGRRGELDLFRANFDTSPEDDRHSFVFHVHGMAGVGKSSLVRELEAVAVRHKAITACTDEIVNCVPEAMAAISAQFARQGAELKALDKLLTVYRQRRHEAESASALVEAGPDPGLPAPPSAGSMAVSQAGLIGLGMVPVVGAFAGAIDPSQVAHGTDRLKAALSARFRNHDDVQLVLEPLKALTPVFIAELDRVAADAPWIALFFDTYERTAPFLDPWLLDLITTDRYGALPANVVITLAGQHGPDPARWADYARFVTEFALEPFTESEARQLLAAKRVVGEDVVREVLRLSGGLPVLVSTLAENPGEVDDPTATAVERFLKWERDRVRREAALICALPRRLDEDVFRAAVNDGGPEEAYEWLRGLPFVSERAGRVQYHDVVRTAMLRLQRARSPRQWTERHARLAEVFGQWRAETEEGLGQEALWRSEPWRELRLEESYHLLCARPHTALRQVLKDLVAACRADVAAARSCAQVLVEAGEHADAEAVSRWGRDLLAALSEASGGVLSALGLLVDRAGFEAPVRAEVHAARGRELRQAGEYDRSIAEYDLAIGLDPESAEAYGGRGTARLSLRDGAAALDDFERADELRPDISWIVYGRAAVLQLMGRYREAAEAFDRVVNLSPEKEAGWASRGRCKHLLGDDDGALADFGRALEIDPEYLWALVHRGELYRDQGRIEESFADLDRAAELAPDSAWIASERGDAYRLVSRFEEAAEELGRACALDPDYTSAHASRAAALAAIGRHGEARVAFDRAVELDPTYVWALVRRAFLRRDVGDDEGMFADLDRAVAADESGVFALEQRAAAYGVVGRFEEALSDYDLALGCDPGNCRLRVSRCLALISLDRDIEAMSELDQVLESEPDDVEALGTRAHGHGMRGRYGEALRDLDRAILLQPDSASLYRDRAETYVSVGRSTEALADLEQCGRLEEQPAAATRRRIVDVLLLSERYTEALRLLDDQRDDDSATVWQRWRAHVGTGRWASARGAAEWLRSNDPGYDPLVPALTVTASDGLSAAEPLWREVPSAGTDLDPDAAAVFDQVLERCALGDWSRADSVISVGLALDHDWEDLAHLAGFLNLLIRSPGADPASLGPRLARVLEARDAFQARYTE
ncbi:tetratricopeptide repeat protein [Streptomyces lincolnensis]|uniref:tetratricopeptide repeat protein n=1 Tax=Streptomyces lincolnensis TaxID=1915 RepID=UPI0037D20625